MDEMTSKNYNRQIYSAANKFKQKLLAFVASSKRQKMARNAVAGAVVESFPENSGTD